MTLPLIYSLKKATWNDRNNVKYIIKNHTDKYKKVREVIEFVKDSGGIEYAHQVMEQFVQEALEILDHFTDSPYRDSLTQMVSFTINRHK